MGPGGGCAFGLRTPTDQGRVRGDNYPGTGGRNNAGGRAPRNLWSNAITRKAGHRIWCRQLGVRIRDLPGQEFPQLPDRIAQPLQLLWNEALAHEALQEAVTAREDGLRQREEGLTARERRSEEERQALAVRGSALGGACPGISPSRTLLDATTSPDRAAANLAFDAMMLMGKIDIAAIEARLGSGPGRG